MEKITKYAIRYGLISIEVIVTAFLLSFLFSGGSFSWMVFAQMNVLVGLSVFAIPLLLFVPVFQVFPLWLVYILVVEWIGVYYMGTKMEIEDEEWEAESPEPEMSYR